MFKKIAERFKISKKSEVAPALAIPSYFDGFDSLGRFRQKKNAEEAKNYDFCLARTNLKFNTNNIAESVIHMLMFALGSGTVAMHDAFMACGLWSSLFVNPILSCIVGYCVCILVGSAQKLYGRLQLPHLTYPEVAEATFLLSPWPRMKKCARAFRYIVEGTLTLHCYSTCAVFAIMIARNLKELVEGSEQLSDEGDPPLKVYILSLMIPCAVVCMVTNLKNLAPFALVADIYAMAVTIVTIWLAFHNAEASPIDRPAFKSVRGLFSLMGMCIFVSETASISLPIENNMAKPKKFSYVVLITMPILTTVMMTIGFFGYWNYGEMSFAPILVHFPFTPFPIQLKVFLCLDLYVIFAMTFYAGFDVVWFYIKRLHQQANYWLWERLHRILHVALIYLLAFSLPNVTRLMGIIGCLFTGPIIFLFPPLIEVVLDWEYPGLGLLKWRLLKCVAIMLFGFIMFTIGTVYNVTGLVYEMKWGREVQLNVLDVHDKNLTIISENFYDNK